ncbi:hypothetical protein MWU78_10500 [Arenibacter sp. F26102]|uniref:hypothetical protein n=1 Tax=Arenibacter sp. F26102 TaxID=2926416 RepID=UPI001FF4AF8B|nr:hypothetical protein [Arenibacter sp. F26102]MCK0146075.1 hypothetical protein [Arenibacter sp. F26102]
MEVTVNRRRHNIKRANRNIIGRQDSYGSRRPGNIKTTPKRTTPINDPSIGIKLIVRLERNNQTLLILRNELDSYVYEPRTPELFERIEYLKDQIEITRIKNSKIIGFLMHHKHVVWDYLDYIKYAISKFYDLKGRIEAYMYDACNDRQEY